MAGNHKGRNGGPALGIIALAVMLLAGCGSEASSRGDATKVADAPRDAAGTGVTCALEASELSKIIGAKVTDDPFTYSEGCAYLYASTGSRAAFVGWSPVDDVNSKPRGDDLLPGIGDAAWVSPGSASGIGKAWTATARVGDRVVSVNVFGPETRDAVIAVLKAAVAKI